MAIIASLLGVGAVVAGAATDTGGLAQAGAGLAAGGGEFARRGLLGYQRSEETTADRSAITYLEATGQSAKGMLTTFQRFQNALSLAGARVDPYQVSHPMPRDRIANLEQLAKASPYFDRVDPGGPAASPRHDARQDRRLHQGPVCRVAAVPQGSRAGLRRSMATPRLPSSTAIRARR